MTAEATHYMNPMSAETYAACGASDEGPIAYHVEDVDCRDCLISQGINPYDCGSGMCDPNTGCPQCNDDRRVWTKRK